MPWLAVMVGLFVLQAPDQNLTRRYAGLGLTASLTFRPTRPPESVAVAILVGQWLLGSQRRIVDVPFLSSAIKGVRIRQVEGCADLQPLRQVRVSQERFAE